VALMPNTIPRSGDVKIDVWVLGFTALLSISASVVSGLLPALQASKPDLNESLKAGASAVTVRPHTRRWRDWLVVAETTLSLILLIGAVLMIRSLWKLHNVELGFDPKNVLTMHFTIPDYKFAPITRQTWPVIWAQQTALIERVVERIKTTPGIVTVAATSSVPLRGPDGFCGFDIAGKPGKGYGANCRKVSNDYFRTMGIRLLKGRTFTEQDTQQSGNVVVVTEEFARRFFPNEEPLGQRLDPSDWNAEIVGVITDVRHKSPNHPLQPAYYVPLSQSMGFRPVSLVVRTAGDPSQLAPAMRHAVWAEDKDQPLEEIATMEQITADTIADSKFISITLAAFALIAMLLGAMGIYGVISYSVTQRSHEIGIRLALGAQTRAVQWLIIRQGMALVALGVGLGLAGALALTRLLEKLLFSVEPTDPLTFAFVPLLLSGVALAACYLPARRATRVDPLVALRDE